eukprot:1009166-Ditylum_brightwellii.AAC.1
MWPLEGWHIYLARMFTTVAKSGLHFSCKFIPASWAVFQPIYSLFEEEAVVLWVWGITLSLTAMDNNNWSSGCNRTGAKQSLFVQGFVYRLPRATIVYFAQTGLPSVSYLTQDIAML